jgi:hypothetical protein
VVTQ